MLLMFTTLPAAKKTRSPRHPAARYPDLGTTVKRSVTGMTSSRRWKRSTQWQTGGAVRLRRPEDYAEYFCDALGTIRDIIEPRGATIVGHWPTAGYHFEASKGSADDDHFVGLAIDEDRQPELTNERVEKWVKQVAEELHLEEIKTPDDCAIIELRRINRQKAIKLIATSF